MKIKTKMTAARIQRISAELREEGMAWVDADSVPEILAHLAGIRIIPSALGYARLEMLPEPREVARG